MAPALSPAKGPVPFPAGVDEKLAVIGGRLEDDNIPVYAEMHRLCAGSILVFATASSVPKEVGEETAAVFKAHGFDVEEIPLYADNAESAAFDDGLVETLNAANGVYFTGGDQANIYNALMREGRETPLLAALRAMHRRGGLLAGSSAGAAMMSQPMMLGGTSLEAMVHGVTDDPEKPGILVGDGLGFFRFGLVDQHFIKRGRLARLVVAMSQTGHRRGFGIDENTAMIIEGRSARICGEYGVFFTDISKSTIDREARRFEDVRLTYLDDGDVIDLKNFVVRPAASKRRVRKSEMVYRAPAHSRRNAFGGYAVYDLMARLVLGDQSSYARDSSQAFDAKSGVNVSVDLRRVKGTTRCLIAKPASGLRMTGVNFRCSLTQEKLSAARIADRETRRARTFGMAPAGQARLLLLGSSPLYARAQVQTQMVNLMGAGPVGVFAAASAEPRRTAEEHVRFFRRHGLEAHDLAITIDTVEYAEHDHDQLDKIANMRSLFLCGGNQIRLVETLLHRGEESAVLRAMAHAYAKGAVLAASSGALAALPAVMIAGGSSYEALRYGVASDLGHQGLVVQEGVGLFAAGIADQNIIRGRRLGRLVVACAEENERFGIGVCEDSAVIARRSGMALEAAGRHGFVLVEIAPSYLALQGDQFVAKDIRLTMFGPGDRVDLHTGRVERRADIAETDKTLSTLTKQLLREGVDIDLLERAGVDPAARHAVKMRIRNQEQASITLDLECSRDDYDD